MKAKTINLLFVLFVLFVSCSLVSCTPTLKRYASSELSQINSPEKGVVQVSSFVTEIERAVAKSEPIILQLDEKGQAALINSLASVCDDAECIYKNLSRKFPKKQDSFDIDRTIVTAKLIFSIQKIEQNYQPANRIAKIVTRVSNNIGKASDSEQAGGKKKANSDEINNLISKVVFTKWDKFETEFKEVDLGSISTTKTSSYGASLSPDHTGTVVGGSEVSASYSNATTEEMKFSDRIIKMNGTISPHELILYQEGIVGIDLEGNSSVKLTIAGCIPILSQLSKSQKQCYRASVSRIA